jgi:hypothetical protein
MLNPRSVAMLSVIVLFETICVSYVTGTPAPHLMDARVLGAATETSVQWPSDPCARRLKRAGMGLGHTPGELAMFALPLRSNKESRVLSVHCAAENGACDDVQKEATRTRCAAFLVCRLRGGGRKKTEDSDDSKDGVIGSKVGKSPKRGQPVKGKKAEASEDSDGSDNDEGSEEVVQFPLPCSEKFMCVPVAKRRVGTNNVCNLTRNCCYLKWCSDS